MSAADPNSQTHNANASVRVAAARTLAAVLGDRRSLDSALPDGLGGLAQGADRALLQELCYGVVRWHGRLEAVARRLLRKPFKRRDGDVHALLLVGLYQLIYLRIPAYAAVTETVAASRALGKPWAAGLLNGVLRNYQRHAQELLRATDAGDVAAFSHPHWLLERLRQDWPQHWRAIAAANNERAPMTLRVNACRQSRAEYELALQAEDLAAHSVDYAADGLVLEQAVDVGRLPGFAAGAVSVQDGAAQLAADLLDPGAGMRVLDACAAPGGKTAHMLERANGLAAMLAVDIDAERLRRVSDNLARLELKADLRQGDAAHPQTWWDGRSFERILLDAPCSATGVIRRHPDIKLLRRDQDIDALATRQAAMLDALWPLLTPGGMLLYATCSVLRAENVQQVSRFLLQHADAQESPIDAAWGHACEHGRQILPGQHGMDGFYYARLEKRR